MRVTPPARRASPSPSYLGLIPCHSLKLSRVVERSCDGSFERELEASVMVTEVKRKVRMNSTQIITTAMLASNAILAAVLGGVILFKGISKKCNAQSGGGLALLSFSILYWIAAEDLSSWMVGLLPSMIAIAVLRQDAIIDRVSRRCDTAIDRIQSANLVPIKVSSDKP